MILLGARSLEGLNLRVEPANKRLVDAGPAPAAACYSEVSVWSKAIHSWRSCDAKSLWVTVGAFVFGAGFVHAAAQQKPVKGGYVMSTMPTSRSSSPGHMTAVGKPLAIHSSPPFRSSVSCSESAS